MKSNKCPECSGELWLVENLEGIYEVRCKRCNKYYGNVGKDMSATIKYGETRSFSIIGSCKKIYLEGKWNDGERDNACTD